jgi:hypothetical protein
MGYKIMAKLHALKYCGLPLWLIRRTHVIYALILIVSCLGTKCIGAEPTEDLSREIAEARPGAVIYVKPGSYGVLQLSRIKKYPPVTVKSMNYKLPAKFSGLKIVNSNGIAFDSIEFSIPLTAPTQNAGDINNLSVINSSNIIFFDILVHSDEGGTLETTGSGLLIRDSNDISVVDSEFYSLHNAIGHLHDEGLKISGNWFHDLWDDGIRGGGSSSILISYNRFKSMHPDKGDPDHPDCIQFWTSNTFASSGDIIVEHNFYSRGRGQSVQGVFFGNEKSIPYHNIIISNNVFAGAGYNGISVKLASDVTIENNIVDRFMDQTSRIRSIDCDHVVVAKNIGAEFGWTDDHNKPESNTGLIKSNNEISGAITDDGYALFKEWTQSYKLHLNASRAPGSIMSF